MSETTRISLREQLGGAPEPDFEIDLPRGWRRHEVGADDRAALERGMRERFMKMQRPDLHAFARQLVDQAYVGLETGDAFAYFSATGDDESTLWIPGSIVVSRRLADGDYTLDDMVAHAIREFGAAPLFGDKRFIRFERDELVTIGESSVGLTTVEYLTPIPTTKRRRALHFTATVGRPADAPADDEHVAAAKLLYDGMISTLRWLRPKAPAVPNE